MKLDLDHIKKVLKGNGLRVTQSRLALAEVLLEDLALFYTPEKLHAEMQNRKVGCDLVSVYRILSKFEEIGLVKKGEFNKTASMYGLNTGRKHRHEHYFKCTDCHTVESFSDCFIAKKEKQLEASGYKNLTHHLEITGLCPDCAVTAG